MYIETIKEKFMPYRADKHLYWSMVNDVGLDKKWRENFKKFKNFKKIVQVQE